MAGARWYLRAGSISAGAEITVQQNQNIEIVTVFYLNPLKGLTQQKKPVIGEKNDVQILSIIKTGSTHTQVVREGAPIFLLLLGQGEAGVILQSSCSQQLLSWFLDQSSSILLSSALSPP